MGAVGDKHQKKIAMKTVRDPHLSLLGGMDQDEAISILKDKFGFTDQQIQTLQD